MIERLLLFGATGDLAGRFLLPGLAELFAAAQLPEGFRVLATGREDLDDAAFRNLAAARLALHATDVPPIAREHLLRSMRYRRVDVTDRVALAELLRDGEHLGGDGAIAVYLALPPTVFAPAVRSLASAGLPAGSRIVLEKPFGEDLDSAVALNRLLSDVTGIAGEQAVFRVDHVLGMATVHNLLGARLTNRIFEPLWNRTHIEQVDVVWDETLALEGRAGYYDTAGALKDVIQNHLLQILCLVAMEPPASLTERELRDCKVDVLRSVRPAAAGEATRCSGRARYITGTPEGSTTAIPAYADEDGVDPSRRTETFAEMMLEIDNERWAGTRFLLRTGKALRQRRKGVIIRFRPVPDLPFPIDPAAVMQNELRIGLDGPESFTLHLTGSAPGPPPHLAPLTLAAPLPANELPAYSHVLLDVLAGDSTLSIRGDEAELAWRVVTPVLQAWDEGLVPLREYPAGSTGPPSISPIIRD